MVRFQGDATNHEEDAAVNAVGDLLNEHQRRAARYLREIKDLEDRIREASCQGLNIEAAGREILSHRWPDGLGPRSSRPMWSEVSIDVRVHNGAVEVSACAVGAYALADGEVGHGPTIAAAMEQLVERCNREASASRDGCERIDDDPT